MSVVSPPALDQLCINTVRGLSIDGVQKANSGHPGLPLGAAPMAHVLWTRHLRHNPRNPKWFNRDRFILSAGHGSMLLYSLLHLTGYDLPTEQLKLFRQWGSMTPGHPENTHTPGVEMATGPLGQGFATSVGIAIAEAHLAAKFNRPGFDLVNHFTFGICSDGDLMEGVAQEAASLAGHLGLGKIIYLYDDNQITIDGPTSIAFTENTAAKFESLGWHIQRVADGNDISAIDSAIANAKQVNDKPSLIMVRTVIGFGSPNKAGSPKSHGAPLGEEEVRLTKRALDMPDDQQFYVPQEAKDFYLRSIEAGEKWESAWTEKFDAYRTEYPAESAELELAIAGGLPSGWTDSLPRFEKAISTRQASLDVINSIAGAVPHLVGGCADLAESVYTEIKSSHLFQSDNPGGRNIAFGIREHAMAAALNGINIHGGLRAFGGTFLIFSDYCRPSIRLSALMHCPTVFVFSHDSIGLGEDGPTHQPIEQVMSLRLIPNFNVLRPADAHETAACWKIALESKETPCALILTRQALPLVTGADASNHPAEKGAYILRDVASPEVILVATGSEVGISLEAAVLLESRGVKTRVVSMPSWFLFDQQPLAYRESVLPKGVKTVSVEAGTTLGWAKYADLHVGIDRFGASAPGPLLMKEFGFTAEHIAEVAQS